MTAKPSGTQPTVNAALVHRQFASLTWGDLHRERCASMVAKPGWFTPGHQEPSAAASCPLRAMNRQQPPSKRTARHAATRDVTAQKSADAVVGGRESGR